MVQRWPAVPTAPPVLDISKLNPGDVIDGRYKYIEKIGKGAFGTVLLMQDEVVDEHLILKFLNPNVSSDEEMMKRFVHELRYSRKITHRNVIRIYDFLHLQGSYAISMEYFPSHTLSGEIPDQKPMDIAKALQFSRDIATGMTVAHQAGERGVEPRPGVQPRQRRPRLRGQLPAPVGGAVQRRVVQHHHLLAFRVPECVVRPVSVPLPDQVPGGEHHPAGAERRGGPRRGDPGRCDHRRRIL